MTRASRTACLAALAVCAALSWPSAPGPLQAQEREAPLAELWVAPDAERDLFHGPGGPALAPDPHARYRIIAIKVGGFSEGYDVEDERGRAWSVKLPPEASTEVVASRLHWGIGYHQPPVYFLPTWHASGATMPNPQLPARFREDDPDYHGLDREGDWSFAENPFVGTRQLAGLLVLQAMLGNSDLKASNNSVYTLDREVEGARRWYVVRDTGHTFGRRGVINAPRGEVEVFERSGFIRGVDGARVEFEGGGRHEALFADISIADVRWICQRLDRLTDRQWQDAFRAGGYEPGVAGRFIRALKRKIAAGLALPQTERLARGAGE